MARLTSGILGPIHGRIGSVVGAVWKQTAYLRTMPAEKKEGKKATPAQQACREKFRFLQQWLVPFYAYITVGFKNYAKDKTEINTAFSKNYRDAVVGVYPDLSIDYAKVVLSQGNLPRLYAVQHQLSAADTLSLTWQQNHNDNSCYDDQIVLMVYSRELKLVDGFIGGRNRADLQCSLKLNPKLIGKQLDVYVSVISLNGRRVSDSEYLGRLAPL